MADIKILAPFILSWEGGFANHPNDRGGATNRGVTIATWKRQGWDKDDDGDIDVDDLKLITPDDATYIMKKNFWDRCNADNITDQSIANLLVDMAWGSGAVTAIKKVQRCLGLVDDGIVGRKTIAALQGKDVFDKLHTMREKWFNGIVANNPTQKVFLRGWLRRLNSIQYGKLVYSNGKEHTF